MEPFDPHGTTTIFTGAVIAEVPLPIAGILSDRPAAEVAEVAEQQRATQRAAIEIGMPTAPLTQQPLFHVLAATLPCIPGPHLTDIGVVDGDTGTIVPSLLVSAAASA
ncbi:hypothetical protein CcI49_35095 [Frankia sp. CcI49]|nr:hypothetical protein CcI49_35095 [Frankia sp. CcI49]